MTTALTPCTEPGCTGVLDDDGYCDVSGMKVSTLAPPRAGASTPTPPSIPSVTPPNGTTSVASVPSGTTARTAVSGRLSRPGLGLGLVDMPEIEVPDPHSVVLDDPRIPDHQKFCGQPECGAPVGRGQEGTPGRARGLLRQVRAPVLVHAEAGPGDLVGGQYDVVGCLAHGGLGWVYLARDRNVENKWVVLKGLLNTGDADAIDRRAGRAPVPRRGRPPEHRARSSTSSVHDGDRRTS